MPETDNPLHMTRDEENSTVVVDGKAPGNTQYVAMLIRQKTGGSLFRLEPVTPYPRDKIKGLPVIVTSHRGKSA